MDRVLDNEDRAQLLMDMEGSLDDVFRTMEKLDISADQLRTAEGALAVARSEVEALTGKYARLALWDDRDRAAEAPDTAQEIVELVERRPRGQYPTEEHTRQLWELADRLRNERMH